jgi:hypothetical protein
MAKKKEFEAASYLGDDQEPAQTDMGASKINYGEQRFGMGVSEEEAETYAQPGDEGELAVRIMISRGGIGSHESFDSPMSGTPTGK